MTSVSNTNVVGMSTADGQCVAIPVADQKVAATPALDQFIRVDDNFGPALGLMNGDAGRNEELCERLYHHLIHRGATHLGLIAGTVVGAGALYEKKVYGEIKTPTWGIVFIGGAMAVLSFFEDWRTSRTDPELARITNLKWGHKIEFFKRNCLNDKGGPRKKRKRKKAKLAKAPRRFPELLPIPTLAKNAVIVGAGFYLFLKLAAWRFPETSALMLAIDLQKQENAPSGF